MLKSLLDNNFELGRVLNINPLLKLIALARETQLVAHIQSINGEKEKTLEWLRRIGLNPATIYVDVEYTNTNTKQHH